MDTFEDKFAISAEKYLDKNHILYYLEDAVSQLLDHKEDNPKVNPSKFFSDYFTSVKEGNHTLFREYAYVRATPHNRACFVRTFWKCFRQIGKKGDLLSIREYHSLFGLLCPDFPFDPVQKTARIILMDDAMDCLISFSDFLYAFQAQFCFDEFLTTCAETYKTLLISPKNPPDPVVVPTSDLNSNMASTAMHQTSESSNGDGVDSMQFFRSLLQICDKNDVYTPPLSVLKEILSSATRVTFYGFLMAMAKSDSLNAVIGKLPKKSELLEATDPELTTPPIRPASANKVRPLSASTNQTPASSSNLKQLPSDTKSSIGMRLINNSPPLGGITGKQATASGKTTESPVVDVVPPKPIRSPQKHRTKPKRKVVISDSDDSDEPVTGGADDSGSSTT